MLNFITFEGIDGSGKSTQVGRLADWLRARSSSRPIVVVKDPGGTAVGDGIRSILLDPAHQSMRVQTEVLLYFASRAQLVWEAIRPALEQGAMVVSDRYYDATMAYQGYARGVDRIVLDQIQRYASGGLEPDLTFVLDVAPEVGLARAAARHAGAVRDRIEGEGSDFSRRVREGYLQLAARHPNRIRVLDASRSPEDVFTAVRAELVKHGV
ncbi:MAG: dTMP kinase [Acidobacteriota bacterium]